MRLFFFNFKAHNGDLHYYREFIKDIIKRIKCEEYYLLQDMPSKLLLDINNLNFDKLNSNCYINETVYRINKDLYINIHPGREIESRQILTEKEASKYNGLSLDYYYYIFSKIYTKLGINISNIEYYIPEIDYSKFEIQNIDEYIQNNNRYKILISNGEVYTFQSPDINFVELVNQLSSDFNSIDFILTEKIDINKDNVLFTDDIIKSDYPDLNEISYLSLFCDIIIGRASGPYCFTITKKNISNVNKSYIFITSSYMNGIYTNYNLCDKLWINDFDYNNIYSCIRDEINRKIKILDTFLYIKGISVKRNGNRFDFSSPGRLYNISVKTYLDNNGDNNFTDAYGSYYDYIEKDVNYYLKVNRNYNSKTKFKIQFFHLQELIYENIS